MLTRQHGLILDMGPSSGHLSSPDMDHASSILRQMTTLRLRSSIFIDFSHKYLMVETSTGIPGLHRQQRHHSSEPPVLANLSSSLDRQRRC